MGKFVHKQNRPSGAGPGCPSPLRWGFHVHGDQGTALSSLLARSFPTVPGNGTPGCGIMGFVWLAEIKLPQSIESTQ